MVAGPRRKRRHQRLHFEWRSYRSTRSRCCLPSCRGRGGGGAWRVFGGKIQACENNKIAQGSVRWPGLDLSIEGFVRDRNGDGFVGGVNIGDAKAAKLRAGDRVVIDGKIGEGGRFIPAGVRPSQFDSAIPGQRTRLILPTAKLKDTIALLLAMPRGSSALAANGGSRIANCTARGRDGKTAHRRDAVANGDFELVRFRR